MNVTTNEPINQDFSMKWHKFLINFSLIAAAVCNIILGFNYVTGGIYAATSNALVTAEQVYAQFGNSLKILDVIYGLLAVGLGIFAIFARQSLAHYKTSGPKKLIILLSLSVIISFLYNLLCLLLFNINSLEQSVASWGLGIGLIIANIKYYRERSSLFCN